MAVNIEVPGMGVVEVDDDKVDEFKSYLDQNYSQEDPVVSALNEIKETLGSKLDTGQEDRIRMALDRFSGEVSRLSGEFRGISNSLRAAVGNMPRQMPQQAPVKAPEIKIPEAPKPAKRAKITVTERDDEGLMKSLDVEIKR